MSMLEMSALFLWTVNPEYLDMIGHLNHFEIVADQSKILLLNLFSS